MGANYMIFPTLSKVRNMYFKEENIYLTPAVKITVPLLLGNVTSTMLMVTLIEVISTRQVYEPLDELATFCKLT